MTSRPGASLLLPSDMTSAALARAFVSQELSSRPVGVVEDAELAVTELVSNAVRHGTGEITLTVGPNEATVHLSVTSAAVGNPCVPGASAQSPTGRGLAIVAAVATDWGWERTGDLVTVWADLSLTA